MPQVARTPADEELRRSGRSGSPMTANELDAAPAQHVAAVRVIEVAGDPRSSATDLATALQADPAMTAQVLRLANSAYYGMSGRVRGVAFAVTMIGFSSVRTTAAAFAAGAMGAEAPTGFWDRAAAGAASAAVVAPQVGANKADGFSVGLLHELGDFLLFRRDADAHAQVHGDVAGWDCRRRCWAEQALFGTDHGEVLAEALETWHFPADFVDAYARHGTANRSAPPLARTLVAGQALSALAQLPDEERMWVADLTEQLTARLDVGSVDRRAAGSLRRGAREDAGVLAACLPVPA
jgi:HD-like signal output (HDOD) protein